jgi:ATP-dependent exoDNAse (exonuclease V) beta subunit
VYARVTEDRKKRESEEADRLLYVAMTRAEEHLVMSYASSGNPEGWAKRVAGQLSVDLQTPGAVRVENVTPLEGEPFAVRIQVATKPPEVVHGEAGMEPASHHADFIARPEIRGQYDSAVSATSLAIFEECPRRYALSRQPAGYASSRAEEELETSDTPDASEVGRQVHALLAGWNVEAGDEACELAARFRESELGQRAAETMLREHEYSFVFALDGVVLSGQMDLWFEHSGELILVDYKTDEVSAEEAREHARIHELQLQLYGMALERMHGGRAPDHTFIYLLRPNVAVPVHTNRARVEGAIRHLREAQEKGVFPMNVGPRCLRCPHYRGSCPSDYGRPAVI